MPEKYYLSIDKVNELINRDHLLIIDDGIVIKTNNSKGYEIAYDGDTINLEQPNSKTRRSREGKQIAQTINT